MNQFYDIAERSFSPQTTEEARIMIQNQVKAFLQLAERTSNFTSCRRSNWVIKRDTSKWDEIRERFYKQYYARYYILSRRWVSTF